MVKQMKVKFDSGFELDDKKQYKVFIICNVVTALGRACALMKDEGIEFASEGSEVSSIECPTTIIHTC